MKRILPLLLVLAFAFPAAGAEVRMAFTMGPSAAGFREAQLVAYPIRGSDFELPLRVAYLGDLDTWVWQLRAEIPEPYLSGDWLLCGYAAHLVALQKFRPTDGATVPLQVVPWGPPSVRRTVGGVSVTWDKPAVPEDLVARWEVLQDGRPLPMDAQGNAVGGTLDRARATGLRAVLVGSPAVHLLDGPAVELVPGLGDAAWAPPAVPREVPAC